MTTNPVTWFEIYVQDMKRASAFYEGVLACKLNPLPTPAPGLIMMAFEMDSVAPGASGALIQMPGCPSGGNSTLIYFHCKDCAIPEARVQAHGGKVFRPKMSIGQYGFVSLITDTEGNMVGLYSPPVAN